MLSAGFAGTERHAIELANGLGRHCDVALLLRDRPREGHRWAAYETLRGAVAPGIPIFLASRAAPWFGFWRALRRFRPDLVHAHHERGARLAGRISRRVPVLATVHMRFQARDFARCDGLIALTEAEAAAIPGAYRGVRAAIGNWVLPHPRPPQETVDRLRAEFGLEAGAYVIGTVGRLAPQKDMAGLIRAFGAAQIPAARLLIIGEGEERIRLERLAAETGGGRIMFAGFRRDVRDLYFLLDLFVLNSVEEPYGLATLEAAASGVPVIATATLGGRAIAERHPVRLVPPGAPAALAAALTEAWRGRGTPAPALAGFAIEDRLPDILRTYQAVLDRPRGATGLAKLWSRR